LWGGGLKKQFEKEKGRSEKDAHDVKEGAAGGPDVRNLSAGERGGTDGKKGGK